MLSARVSERPAQPPVAVRHEADFEDSCAVVEALRLELVVSVLENRTEFDAREWIACGRSGQGQFKEVPFFDLRILCERQ